jgi:hypothetical protein
MPPWLVQHIRFSMRLTPSQILAQPPKPLLSVLTSPPFFHAHAHLHNVIFAQPLAPCSTTSVILGVWNSSGFARTPSTIIAKVVSLM